MSQFDTGAVCSVYVFALVPTRRFIHAMCPVVMLQ